jgi:hypothetical protein
MLRAAARGRAAWQGGRGNGSDRTRERGCRRVSRAALLFRSRCPGLGRFVVLTVGRRSARLTSRSSAVGNCGGHASGQSESRPGLTCSDTPPSRRSGCLRRSALRSPQTLSSPLRWRVERGRRDRVSLEGLARSPIRGPRSQYRRAGSPLWGGGNARQVSVLCISRRLYPLARGRVTSPSVEV